MSAGSTIEDVLEGRARWCVVVGDSLPVLAALPPRSIDAVITDPPYSSGGLFRGDRAKSTDRKYTLAGGRGARPDFQGDVRDQRWRQAGATQDAIQCAGWILRGMVPWDKGEGSRPVPGGFRQSCEFVHWATVGALPPCVAGVTVPTRYHGGDGSRDRADGDPALRGDRPMKRDRIDDAEIAGAGCAGCLIVLGVSAKLAFWIAVVVLAADYLSR